jgi:hypothetical protein
MGLDMYLYKKHYVQNWDHSKHKFSVTITKDGEPISLTNPVYVVEQAGYWRKANSIHKWFVDNVQDGKDDCKEYYVSPEKMEKLLDICKQVIANPNRAKDLLPTISGFFFGNTEYDEYYLRDMENTVKILESALHDYDNMDISFYYHSSW